MSVGALVLEAGGDEDQAIAALLHDAMEDQGGRPTLDKIKQLYGDRVANTVEECSDSDAENPAKKKSWHERKRIYLAHLPHASPDALLVSLADKLHNARAVLSDYRTLGADLWSRFNKEASKKDQLGYYHALVTAFRETATPRAMTPGLVHPAGTRSEWMVLHSAQTGLAWSGKVVKTE